jgi:hypothetical protein
VGQVTDGDETVWTSLYDARAVSVAAVAPRLIALTVLSEAEKEVFTKRQVGREHDSSNKHADTQRFKPDSHGRFKSLFLCGVQEVYGETDEDTIWGDGQNTVRKCAAAALDQLAGQPLAVT